MKVTSKGDPMKFIDYGHHVLTCGEFPSLVIMGSGTSIDVAVKVADQLKQRVEGLH
jgi:transketolase